MDEALPLRSEQQYIVREEIGETIPKQNDGRHRRSSKLIGATKLEGDRPLHAIESGTPWRNAKPKEEPRQRIKYASLVRVARGRELTEHHKNAAACLLVAHVIYHWRCQHAISVAE
jgi:hypothetical protein